MVSPFASRRDFCFIVCAAVLWGTVGVATQLIYVHSATNALSLAFLRLAFATPLFLLASWILPGRCHFRVKPRDFGVMLLMGGMQALYQTSYNAAIASVGVTISTLIALCIAPIIVALFSTIVVRERLTLTTLIALGGALVGTLLLVAARSRPGEGNVSLLGILLALLAAGGYAGYILWGRLLTHSYHPLHVNTVAFATGALLLFFCASLTRLVVSYASWEWLVLLYLGSVPTALAYALFQMGMRSLSATVVSIVTLCEPLTAALLAWICFGEELGALGILGALLMLGAMVLLVRRA